MIVFVLKYTENDMKDKYVYSLHNKNFRNVTLYYIAFLSYSGDSLGIPLVFPVTINRISRDIPVWAGSRPVAVKALSHNQGSPSLPDEVHRNLNSYYGWSLDLFVL